ncbi:MAG: hypothetical protein ACSHX4_02305 [Opitutaceae bacterium]
MTDLLTEGYQIIRDVFTPDEVALLCDELSWHESEVAFEMSPH